MCAQNEIELPVSDVCKAKRHIVNFAKVYLEAGGAPVHELNVSSRLQGGDGGVDVLGHDVTTVQHAAGHVLAVGRLALHHLVGRLEAGVGDLSYGQLLVIGFLRRHHRGVGGQGEVDARVGDQVSLELRHVHVQGAVEAQGGGDGGDDLADQTVEVGVGGMFDVQVAATDVVDGLVVDHEGAVGVLQGGVGGQDGVVGLHHSSRHLQWKTGFLQSFSCVRTTCAMKHETWTKQLNKTDNYFCSVSLV